MRYWCESEDKKVLFSNILKRQSDFNWYAEIPLLSQWEHRQFTVIVEALFNNGEVRRCRRSFFYENTEKWHTKMIGHNHFICHLIFLTFTEYP